MSQVTQIPLSALIKQPWTSNTFSGSLWETEGQRGSDTKCGCKFHESGEFLDYHCSPNIHLLKKWTKSIPWAKS